jgi:hypothetical protein
MKCHNEIRHLFFCAIRKSKFKRGRIRRADDVPCLRVYKYFMGKTEGKRLLEDLNIREKLILKLFLTTDPEVWV